MEDRLHWAPQHADHYPTGTRQPALRLGVRGPVKTMVRTPHLGTYHCCVLKRRGGHRMLSWENGIRIEVGVQTLVPVRCYRIVGVVSFCVVGAGNPGVKRPQSQPRPPGQRPQKTRARMRPNGGAGTGGQGVLPQGHQTPNLHNLLAMPHG